MRGKGSGCITAAERRASIGPDEQGGSRGGGGIADEEGSDNEHDENEVIDLVIALIKPAGVL